MVQIQIAKIRRIHPTVLAHKKETIHVMAYVDAFLRSNNACGIVQKNDELVDTIQTGGSLRILYRIQPVRETGNEREKKGKINK